MNNFEKFIANAIANAANKKYNSLDEELEAFTKHEKFKTMRESCERFGMMAWYLVLTSIRGKDVDTNQVIEETINNAVNIWGDKAKEAMNDMGINTRKDIVDILIIASEHGVVEGSPDEYSNGDLF